MFLLHKQKNWQMHTFIINAILIMMCNSDMLQLSKGYLSVGSTKYTFQQQDQNNELQDVKLHAAH
jgi:hypothetical protein